MKIGILGSGMVGQTVGEKLVQLGHDVVLGTRDPSRLSEARGMAGSLQAWLDRVQGTARVATFAAAAEHGELIVNATSGTASLQALQAAGAPNLAGKVLLDIANPLDFTPGKPLLAVSDTDSLGEQIQAAFPDAMVVKALNTVNASLMVDPGQLAGADHTIFVSGNAPEAKATVADLLRSFGWRDILDLGDISTARGTEMYLPLWLRLYGKVQSPNFNVKVVR